MKALYFFSTYPGSDELMYTMLYVSCVQFEGSWKHNQLKLPSKLHTDHNNGIHE